MAKITIPLEIEFTPRSRAIMDALYKVINSQFHATEDSPVATATALNVQPGEHYAGILLNEDGQHVAHLVLMAARPDTKLNWQDAMEWAKSTGGDLPDRQEQSLLFANCRSLLKPDWHWSCEPRDDDASYAWYCYFGSGTQYAHKSYEGCAVAVRLIPLTA